MVAEYTADGRVHRHQSVQPRPPGPCFSCGEPGHIRKFCPKFPDTSNKKWYPSECLSLCDGASDVCISSIGSNADAYACSSNASCIGGTSERCAGLVDSDQVLDSDIANCPEGIDNMMCCVEDDVDVCMVVHGKPRLQAQGPMHKHLMILYRVG